MPTGLSKSSVYPRYLVLKVPAGTSGLKVSFNSFAFFIILLTLGSLGLFSINLSASFINSLFWLNVLANLLIGESVSSVPNSALRAWDRDWETK